MILSNNDFYETAFEDLRGLKEERHDLASLLDYYTEVLRAQSEVGAGFHADIDAVDENLCKKRLSNHLPMFRPAEAVKDTALFDTLFYKIADISRKYAADEQKDLWPSRSNGKGVLWHENLLKGLVENKDCLTECADKAHINRGVFAFLACQAAAPFLESYARAFGGLADDSTWLMGFCPVCGGEPLIARLAKETGKKTLLCHLCRTEWGFKRLECPFCGCDEQEKLRFFYDEKDRTCRVDVCDNCKTYLKAVDARETQKDVALFVSNLATLHLDVVAKHEGFQRETNRLFGL